MLQMGRDGSTQSYINSIAEQLSFKIGDMLRVMMTRPALLQCPESLLKSIEVGVICINFRHSVLDSVEDNLLVYPIIYMTFLRCAFRCDLCLKKLQNGHHQCVCDINT